MQLVLVSSGLRVISLGRTDGNAVLLVMPCSYSVLTGRSLSRDELMAEVGGCMEETAPAVAIPASVAGGTAQSLWTCRMFYCGAPKKLTDLLVLVLFGASLFWPKYS